MSSDMDRAVAWVEYTRGCLCACKRRPLCTCVELELAAVFAAVRAKQRAECAALADDVGDERMVMAGDGVDDLTALCLAGEGDGAYRVARAIRARTP